MRLFSLLVLEKILLYNKGEKRLRELKAVAEKAKSLFIDSPTVSGNWAKWYHEGIPDEEGEKREKVREKAAILNHCMPCTAISGCYFIDTEKTCPINPHHPNCHCKKLFLKPTVVTAVCDIRKFTNYIFSEDYEDNGKRKLFEESFGFTINDSEYLKSEFDKQAKEKYISGDYILGKLDENGQRITIPINIISPFLGKITLKTGWMVHTNGKIICATPLGGKFKKNSDNRGDK